MTTMPSGVFGTKNNEYSNHSAIQRGTYCIVSSIPCSRIRLVTEVHLPRAASTTITSKMIENNHNNCEQIIAQ